MYSAEATAVLRAGGSGPAFAGDRLDDDFLRPDEANLGRLAAQLAGFQVAIYLVQEALERLEAGIPAHALLDGRLLVIGVAVQSAIALVLAVLLAAAGRVAEAAGRALRPRPRRAEPAGRPVAGPAVAWPIRLLAAGRGSRAPPRSLVTP